MPRAWKDRGDPDSCPMSDAFLKTHLETLWQHPAEIPPLESGHAHLWRLDLAAASVRAALEEAHGWLTNEEQARAGSFRSSPARLEFVAGRSLLRMLVARALDKAPNEVIFAYSASGKPMLRTPCGLDFNVAHTRGLILVGVSRMGPIGVDVEWIDPQLGGGTELDDLARGALQPEEFSILAGISSERQRVLEFYRFWTRREAVAKADGRGIASAFTYSVHGADEHGETRLLLADETNGAKPEYFVQFPSIGEGYMACCALLHRGAAISFFNAGQAFSLEIFRGGHPKKPDEFPLAPVSMVE